ncbi:MAG: hypothetical protein CMM78_00245 [Rhodospirillaceae bacterium]|nr:hypothetical protein [Rhodospirillales bacterium]MAX46619.1 hypothetical protein [Rhodospirillaceae bacterium]
MPGIQLIDGFVDLWTLEEGLNGVPVDQDRTVIQLKLHLTTFNSTEKVDKDCCGHLIAPVRPGFP